MYTFFTKWSQIFTSFFITGPLFRIFFRFRVLNKEKIKDFKGPVLIVSNHRFELDTFALGASYPTKVAMFPVRIMGETKKFRGPFMEFLRKTKVIAFVYGLFGVFPAIRGKNLSDSLKIPIQIINQGGVVFLHPEGRVVKRGGILQFKRGASYIALKTGVKILPVAFEMKKGGLRKKYLIKFGDMFYLPKDLTVEEGAEYMREKVLKLHESI